MKTDNPYIHLKSGSDIRGVAVDGVAGENVELTDDVIFHLTAGFCRWLREKGRGSKKIAVGHDSRISAQRIKKQVIEALSLFDCEIYDCGYASTPAMFMTTIDLDCDASVQITASHHPFNRNGLKFFTKDGGLDPEDIERITVLADSSFERKITQTRVKETDYMSVYSERLRNMICREVNAEDYDHPLKGYKIVVDAGNGVGGFYAEKVLAPLGADVAGSQFLEPDGMFPNHIPNPENSQAMEYICRAVKANGADLGIIFDTDVDRAGCVDEKGREINRNRLVALASVIALEDNAGGTIVTDSVTSTGLTDFIEQDLGGVHYRFKRGYRNVINEQMRLQREGINCPLAMETSGHAAFRDNYYLDDGAYLVTKIIVKMAQMGKQGKKLESLIENLREPMEAKELRFRINAEDFRAVGLSVIEKLEHYAAGKEGWRIADDNREGIRIYFDGADQKGWLLIRLSVHDPIMPLNVESDVAGGVKRIAAEFAAFIRDFRELDVRPLDEFLS
ncbi:MAG: phosphomannomutase/phosphoglucomutase [Oscillospiraceae bacterium]|nr:phosphomannomutase/phosphoglucomutase [Oscillospiraceae bacterium]